MACLDALEGFEAGSEAVQALNEATLKLEAAAERARLGAARSSLLRAHPAMDVIQRALLLLVDSIGDGGSCRSHPHCARGQHHRNARATHLRTPQAALLFHRLQVAFSCFIL